MENKYLEAEFYNCYGAEFSIKKRSKRMERNKYRLTQHG